MEADLIKLKELRLLVRVSVLNLKYRSKANSGEFKGINSIISVAYLGSTLKQRRRVQLIVEQGDDSDKMMDMLLAKKRAADRKIWLEYKGNLAEI